DAGCTDESGIVICPPGPGERMRELEENAVAQRFQIFGIRCYVAVDEVRCGYIEDGFEIAPGEQDAERHCPEKQGENTLPRSSRNRFHSAGPLSRSWHPSGPSAHDSR